MVTLTIEIAERAKGFHATIKAHGLDGRRTKFQALGISLVTWHVAQFETRSEHRRRAASDKKAAAAPFPRRAASRRTSEAVGTSFCDCAVKRLRRGRHFTWAIGLSVSAETFAGPAGSQEDTRVGTAIPAEPATDSAMGSYGRPIVVCSSADVARCTPLDMRRGPRARGVSRYTLGADQRNQLCCPETPGRLTRVCTPTARVTNRRQPVSKPSPSRLGLAPVCS
jgi:hypothetical protein